MTPPPPPSLIQIRSGAWIVIGWLHNQRRKHWSRASAHRTTVISFSEDKGLFLVFIKGYHLGRSTYTKSCQRGLRKKEGRAPKWPAPVSVDSPHSSDKEEFTWENFRALLAWIDALEKEKASRVRATGARLWGQVHLCAGPLSRGRGQKCTSLYLPGLPRVPEEQLIPCHWLKPAQCQPRLWGRMLLPLIWYMHHPPGQHRGSYLR